MKRKFFTTALFVVGCFMVCFAAIADLNGKWGGKIDIGGTEYPLLYNFKVDGDKLTGTALTPEGDVPLSNGKTDGTTFSFSISTSGMDIPHTGKFYGDSTGIDLEVNGSKIHTVLKRPVEKR